MDLDDYICEHGYRHEVLCHDCEAASYEENEE